jgi:hypothetical protein
MHGIESMDYRVTDSFTDHPLYPSGRSFAIIPRSVAPHGYIDAAIDDLEGEPWQYLQKATLAASIRTMAGATQNS